MLVRALACMYAVFHTVPQNLLGVDSECNVYFSVTYQIEVISVE